MAAAAIAQEWAGTGQEAKALHVVQRESGCDPCAFYPGRSDCNAMPHTAKGLFQLLGHDGLIFAACPNPWGIVWWQDPVCNARAARWLYDGSGWSPWAASGG